MKILVFDIETVPDVESGRRIYDLSGIADEDVARAMVHLHVQKTGSEFLPPHLHQIVAIAVVFRDSNQLGVCSLGKPDTSETELVRLFFGLVDKHTPQLVSWNGSGFDLPTLQYRALLHNVSSSKYWDRGEYESSFRYNNYLSRYHTRHLDLMDVLARYQTRAFTPLNQVAKLLGFPGKSEMDGERVEEAWRGKKVHEIRNYCETDVLNTYLIFLKFELAQDQVTKSIYQRNCEQLHSLLRTQNKPHYTEFLNAWEKQGQEGCEA